VTTAMFTRKRAMLHRDHFARALRQEKEKPESRDLARVKGNHGGLRVRAITM